MTNVILAKIVVVLVTNWTTVSKTFPVGENWPPNNLAVWGATLNQHGWRATNYVAKFEWRGKVKEVVLSSDQDASQALPMVRSIPEPVQTFLGITH